MADYTLAIGTRDPHGFAASDSEAAVRYAVGYIESRHADVATALPQEVVSLLGPDGLVTRASERLDEFLGRVPGRHPGDDPVTVQTGDSNTPDCNGD